MLDNKYIEVENFRLFYRHCGKGKPVVLIHAASASSRIWLPVISILKQKFSLFAPDLPGHGNSQPLNENDPIPDMPKVINDFMEKLSIKSADVIGASRGGLIGIQLAVRFPSKVKKLVLVSSAGLPDAIRPPLELQPKKFEDLFINKSIITQDFLNKYVSDDAKKAEIYEKIRKSSLPKDYYLKGILCDIVMVRRPTLIVWGEKDPTYPLVCGYIFQALIKNSKLVVISNVGHSPNLEAPDSLAEIIKDFL